LRCLVRITLRALRRLLVMVVFVVVSTALAIPLLWALFITFRAVIALLVLL
jgi:hypothetical protein